MIYGALKSAAHLLPIDEPVAPIAELCVLCLDFHLLPCDALLHCDKQRVCRLVCTGCGYVASMLRVAVEFLGTSTEH
jgi:hypothetical protein